MRYLRNITVERAICGVFFLSVLLSGIVTCFAATHDFSLARASLSWPTADAVHFSSDRGVRYAYSWRGKNYLSTRARFFTGHAIGHGVWGEPQCPSCKIEVRVSPQTPEISVLIPGAFRSTFAFFIACGGVLSFIGAGGLARTLSMDEWSSNEAEPGFVLPTSVYHK